MVMVYFGLFLIFVILVFFGFSSIYVGIKGIFGGAIDLILKRHYVGDASDSSSGISARLWGIIYVIFGFIFIGAGLAMIFLVISALRK